MQLYAETATMETVVGLTFGLMVRLTQDQKTLVMAVFGIVKVRMIHAVVVAAPQLLPPLPLLVLQPLPALLLKQLCFLI